MTVDPYCYDNGTLKNRFGILDPTELAQVEFEAVAIRTAEVDESPPPGAFDLAHLQTLHRYLFGDVYPWAGEIRTVEVSKGDVPFCLARFIQQAAVDVFAAVPNVIDELESSRGHRLERLADLYGELNALHPFREGNGRTQRAFLAMVARLVEQSLNWSVISPRGNIDASVAAAHGDNTGLHAALRLAAGLDLLDEHYGWASHLRLD